MEVTELAANPVVSYAGTGNWSRRSSSRGNLIGNLEYEKANDGAVQLVRPGAHARGAAGNPGDDHGNPGKLRAFAQPSAAREPPAAEATRATTGSPRERRTRNKINEGTTSRSREPEARRSETRSTGNTGNSLSLASPYRDVHLTEGEWAGNLELPEQPRGNICPCAAPLDLGGREPKASTVYVGNIHYDASELESFNSVSGVYGDWEPNIAVAVNFVY